MSCLRDRTASSWALGDRPQAASNVNISRQAIRNRLHEAGMRSRCPAVRPPLTPAHRGGRRTWAALHRKWTRDPWARLIFSGESRFTFSFNDGQVHVWRRPGERYADATVRHHNRFVSGFVMVWGGFSLNYRTPYTVWKTV